MSLDTQLAQLETAQLVRRAPDEDPAYLFKHTLTQETAYESLLVKKRREIHRRVAASIEQLYADRVDEYAAVLAQHYAEAGDEAKTLEYATRAGDLAARVYANAEAVAYYSRALGAARESPAQRDLFLKRGRALELSGKYGDALANYKEMEEAARERGDRAQELASLMARATIRSIPSPVFNPQRAQALCDRALALAREMEDGAAEAKLLWILSVLDWFTLRTHESVTSGEQSLALARRLDLREQLAYTLNNLSYSYLSLGRTEESEAVIGEARELWRVMDNKPMLADALGVQAENDFVLGEFDRGLRRSAEALRLSQSIGSLWGQSYSQFYTGHIYWERGDPTQGIQIMSECIRLAEQAGFAVPQFGTRAELGWLYATSGAVEQGRVLIRKAQEVSEGVPIFGFWIYAFIARVQLLVGDVAAAEAALGRLHANWPADYIGTIYPNIAFTCAFADIELALAQRDYSRAAALGDRAITFLEGARLRLYLPEARLLAAQARRGQADLERARAELAAARAAAEAIGSRRMLWQILGAWSEVETARGDPAEAADLRAEAREIVEYIAARTPPDLRELFLRLPQVRSLLDTAAPAPP